MLDWVECVVQSIIVVDDEYGGWIGVCLAVRRAHFTVFGIGLGLVM